MNYNRIYKAVEEEYTPEIALVVVQMLTINLSNYPTDEEFETRGLYEERLHNIFHEVFWEIDRNDFLMALAIFEKIHDWEISQFDVKKTFKQLIKGE